MSGVTSVVRLLQVVVSHFEAMTVGRGRGAEVAVAEYVPVHATEEGSGEKKLCIFSEGRNHP